MLVTSVFVLFLSGCGVFANVGLNPSTVSGDEARSILQDRLAGFFVKDISDQNATSLGLDFFIADLAQIKPGSNYWRRDVEHCASVIYLVALAIDQPQITARTASSSDSRWPGPLLCSLKEVGTWDLKQ